MLTLNLILIVKYLILIFCNTKVCAKVFNELQKKILLLETKKIQPARVEDEEIIKEGK